MKSITAYFLTCIFAITMCAAMASAQDEPETLVVTPVNTRGWSTADTRTGGLFAFVEDSTAPLGTGAASLITDNTNAAKAQYMHAADTALSAVTALGYSSKTNSASFFDGAASYQLVLCLAGVSGTTCNGFTTMVYEPYNNGNSITFNIWRNWDVDAGTMWSSSTVNAGTCQVVAGAGGPPFYSLAMLKTNCPNAKVVGYGVNVGSYNPDYDTEVDKFVFQNTTYDFELYSTPFTVEDCKKGGWSTFNPPTGPYKNQGQCVSSIVVP